MIPVKIECECGQRYAFDVEPINGKMSGTVACPNCSSDGTAIANEYLSQFAPVTAASHAEPVRLVTAMPTSTVAKSDSRRRPVDFGKAEKEARAKMMWGDSVEQVTAFLKVKGINHSEALELANKLFQERAAIVRSNGIKKIIGGSVLVCVPIVAYFVFRAIGRFPIKISMICYGIGIYGAYMFITGIMAVVAPKSEQGAVAKE